MTIKDDSLLLRNNYLNLSRVYSNEPLRYDEIRQKSSAVPGPGPVPGPDCSFRPGL